MEEVKELVRKLKQEKQRKARVQMDFIKVSERLKEMFNEVWCAKGLLGNC